MTILVGRSAADNDILTFKLAAPKDFWLHVASESGSHVVVLNPEGLESLPRDTLRYAASLAAGYSKAKAAKRIQVHVAQRRDVKKPRGLSEGKVVLSRYRAVKVPPKQS